MDWHLFIIKLITIVIIFIVFGILGFAIGIFLDKKLFPQFNPNKSEFYIWADIVSELAVFGIFLFIARFTLGDYINKIVNTSDWNEQRDIKSSYAFIFTLTMLYVQYNLQKKLDYLTKQKYLI